MNTLLDGPACTYCERPLADVFEHEHVTWTYRGLTWTFCSKPCHDDFLVDSGHGDEVVYE